MNNPEIATLLNNLVEISRDGTEGFKTCADNASDPALKAYFQECAQSCEEAVRILTLEVMHYSGNPDMSGTAAGGLHRTWINLKTVLTEKDNLAVLEECEMGEAAACWPMKMR